MKDRTSFFMNFVMLAIFVTLVGIAAGYPPQARFMPFVVGIPAIALCLLQIVLDLRAFKRDAAVKRAAVAETEASPLAIEGDLGAAAEKAESESAAVNNTSIPPGMVRREIVLWSYFLGLIGGILLFGFWPAIPVFLFIFLRFEGELSWIRAFLVAGIGFTVLYLGVAKGLRVELHDGFITSYLLDRWEG